MVSFIKGLLGIKKEDQTEFFKNYKGEAKFFIYDNGKKNCLFSNAQILFMEKDPYEYYIHIINKSKDKPSTTIGGDNTFSNEYFFPINEQMNLKAYYIENNNDMEIIGFEWNVHDPEDTIALEFNNKNVDLNLADEFKDICCKLIWQNKSKKYHQKAKPYEFLSFCKEQEEEEKKEIVVDDKEKKIDNQEKSVGYEEKKVDYEDKNVDFEEKKEFTSQSNTNQHHEVETNNQQADLSAEFDKLKLSSSIEIKPEDTKPSHENDNKNNENTKPVEESRINLSKEHSEQPKSSAIPTFKFSNTTIPEILSNTIHYKAKTKFFILNTSNQLVQVGQYLFMIAQYGKFDYKIHVLATTGSAILYSKDINSDLSFIIDMQEGLFKWVDIAQDTLEINLYAISIMPNVMQFKFIMSRCVFEANRKETIKEVFEKEDEKYVEKYIGGIIEEDSELNKDYENDKDLILVEECYKSNEGITNNSVISSSSNTFTTTSELKNTGHVQAKMVDREYVTKGSIISVYKTNEEDKVIENIGDLPILKALDGEVITPNKVLLHEQDKKMLLLSENDDKKVYYMDIEQGKIIDEFQVDGINSIFDVTSVEKHAEFTHNPTFLAINNKNIFKMDPRINGPNKKAESKIYAKPPHFTCITTNIDEHFATGSQTGEIRLFKQIGQNAKNLFPGLGDSIISLDSTKDGKWLLATTKTYLLVISTMVDGKSGYLSPLSKDKNIPRKLTLLPEHMKEYGLKHINFTPARFNDIENQHEKYIVSSTGNLLITWSLKNVIKGNVFKYEIKKFDDKVVSNDFKYNKEDSLFITLANEVRIQKAKPI